MDVQATVERLLRQYPRLRSSDDLLYGSVINEAGHICVSVGDFFKHRKDLGVPPYETVRRTRQKVQAMHPELRPSEETQERRRELAGKYAGYATTGDFEI